MLKLPGNGHSVEDDDPVNTLNPPGGERILDKFACLNCYAPHNNGNYRVFSFLSNREMVIG